MEPVDFEATTRRSASDVSRRGALMTLAGAGLTAAFAQRVSAAKKDKRKKKGAKKDKQKAKRMCRNQVGPCVDFFEPLCAKWECEPEELLRFHACCAQLGQCNSGAFLDCLFLS